MCLHILGAINNKDVPNLFIPKYVYTFFLSLKILLT